LTIETLGTLKGALLHRLIVEGMNDGLSMRWGGCVVTRLKERSGETIKIRVHKISINFKCRALTVLTSKPLLPHQEIGDINDSPVVILLVEYVPSIHSLELIIIHLRFHLRHRLVKSELYEGLNWELIPKFCVFGN
jgi:hypothetical protein